MRLTATSKLRLRDVLVLRVDEADSFDEGALQALAEQLSGLVRIPIIILNHNQTLQSLSEREMAEAGWVRLQGGNGHE
jgi:hypothetical protein